MRSWLIVSLAILACTLVTQASDREQQAQAAYARWQVTRTASPEDKALMEDVLFRISDGEKVRALDESGGPDGFGYRWVDNQNGDTATFAWVELCGDPLAQFGPSGDDDVGLIGWSFSFPFYGATYASAFVCVNGKLTFESEDGAWLNRCSTIDAAQPTINVYWDDLVAQQEADCEEGTSRIKYRDFGDYVVIEWKNVWHYPDPAQDHRYSFEAILFDNGSIKLQYDTLNCGAYCNSATVNIDVPGANGVEYICNGLPEANNLGHSRAVWFYGLPPSPQELVIRAQPPNIHLSWRSVADADSYCVYRDTTSDIEISAIYFVAATVDTCFTDIGIVDSPESEYFYAVTAVRP